MDKLEFILENSVAIKRLDYHNGKSIIIYRFGEISDYYGLDKRNRKVLLGRYHHDTHILDVNTRFCDPRDSTLRACIMSYLLGKNK